jgi:hypothetical protein
MAKKKIKANEVLSTAGELSRFYDKHRGGSGCVVIVEAQLDTGRLVAAFSSIEQAEEWTLNVKRDHPDIDSVLLIPAIVDVPEFGTATLN